MNVILVVAEDRAVCESLRAALSDADLALIEPTIEDALRRLIAIQADAAIVDDTSSLGLAAARRLREACPGLPVVLLTSRSDPETLAAIALAGASGYLVKPFSCDELRRILGGMMRPPLPAVPSNAESELNHARRSAHLNQYQTALRWLSRISSYMADARRLSESLIDAMVDIFDAVRCAVVLDEANEGIRVTAGHGLSAPLADAIRLRFESGLMRWFEINPCVIDRSATGAPDALKEMSVLGARLGAPLLRGGRVCGALLVGDKASGGEYGQEEIELLSMMARGASIALENAHRYSQLALQQHHLNTVLSNVSSGVVVVRPDKSVFLMNGSAERILQLRASEIIGRSVQKLGSAFADVVLRTLADGKPRTRQEIRDPAINAPLGLSATPLGDQGVVIIFSRLPEEKASSEEIAYSPFWEYLASRVAQEIKNPLVAVNTFAQLLPRKYESADFREAFGEVVQKEVNRINSVVETLFDFARHPRLMLKRVNGAQRAAVVRRRTGSAPDPARNVV